MTDCLLAAIHASTSSDSHPTLPTVRRWLAGNCPSRASRQIVLLDRPQALETSLALSTDRDVAAEVVTLAGGGDALSGGMTG